MLELRSILRMDIEHGRAARPRGTSVIIYRAAFSFNGISFRSEIPQKLALSELVMVVMESFMLFILHGLKGFLRGLNGCLNIRFGMGGR